MSAGASTKGSGADGWICTILLPLRRRGAAAAGRPAAARGGGGKGS